MDRKVKIASLGCISIFIGCVLVTLIVFIISSDNRHTKNPFYSGRYSTEDIILKDIPTGIHDPNTSHSSKVYNKTEGSIEATVKLGNDQIERNGKGYMLLSLKGLEDRASTDDMEQPPINLSIVIDRSGSMSGDKLDYVKEALSESSKYFDGEDRVSIIVYDNIVDVVYEPGLFDEEKFLSAISRIEDNGGTNLEGGLRKGLEINSDFDDSNYIGKVILLSDGLANVGISDHQRLGEIVNENKYSDISVSTIGVGSDYDEKIMTTIAKEGNGNYYFLEDPKDSERIFTQEFETTLNTVAKDIRVEFNFDDLFFEDPKGIGYELNGRDYFEPNNIYSGSTNTFLFEINEDDFTAIGNIGTIPMADIQIEFTSLPDQKSHVINLPIEIGVINKPVGNTLADDDVYKEFMENYQANGLWEVYEDLNMVNNQQAQEIITKLESELELANIRTNGEFDEDLIILKEKREYIVELKDRDVNLDRSGRIFQKSNQYDSYEKKYNK